GPKPRAARHVRLGQLLARARPYRETVHNVRSRSEISPHPGPLPIGWGEGEDFGRCEAHNRMNRKKLHLIGELMNNSYARARKAFSERNVADYQHLARLQTDLGADFLTLNLDGTQRIQVRRSEMLALL